MKLAFFSSEFFWGGLLILIGLSMIIKTIFGIDIPIIRTFVAIFLIYLGVSIITDIGNKKRHTIAFDQETVFPEAENYYKIRFGKGIVDLKHLKKAQEIQNVTIDVMFGDSTLKIPKDIPAKITINTNFGNTTLPDGTHISSGTYTYKTDQNLEDPYIDIQAKVTFGNLKIVNT